MRGIQCHCTLADRIVWYKNTILRQKWLSRGVLVRCSRPSRRILIPGITVLTANEIGAEWTRHTIPVTSSCLMQPEESHLRCQHRKSIHLCNTDRFTRYIEYCTRANIVQFIWFCQGPGHKDKKKKRNHCP